MLAYGISRRGAVRPNNEDCFFCDPSAGLIVVADGIGGHVGGEIASKLAVEAVTTPDLWQSRPQSAAAKAFAAANAAILARAEGEPSLNGMGTTLTLVKIDGPALVIGHIGDSRAYLFRAGNLARLTTDHSISGQLQKAGKITDTEARVHPQRHILTRALGFAEAQWEIMHQQGVPGDLIMLCTDGLSDVVSEEEIAAVLAETISIEEYASCLVDLAYQKGAPDNVTVVLAKL